MGDDKTGMFSFPGPAGGGGAAQIQGQQQQPDIEPWGLIDIGAGDAGAESRLEKGGHGTDAGKAEQKENREIEGAQGINRAPDTGTGQPIAGKVFPGLGGKHSSTLDWAKGGTSAAPRCRRGFRAKVRDRGRGFGGRRRPGFLWLFPRR